MNILGLLAVSLLHPFVLHKFPSETVVKEKQLPGVSASEYQRNGIQVDVSSLGITGDGKTDVTGKLQEALNKYSSLYFPKGKYVLSSSLDLNSNQRLEGKDAVFVLEKNSKISAEFYFLQAKVRSDIYISGLNFEATEGIQQPIYAIGVFNCKGINLKNINSVFCGLINVNVPKGIWYSQVSVDSGNEDIQIENCIGKGSDSGTSKSAGILLVYASNWKVTDCKLTGYSQGVQWWGGDSNPQKDGALTNKRKSRNGIVENVSVTRVSQGGIWGSMGENIIVRNCHVSGCNDVGIDFEGCFDSEATDNVVENCKNGGLATFFYNKNIVFSNNQIIQTDPSHLTACIYNSTQTQNNKTITFKSNEFRAEKGIGLIKQSGPSNDIVFTDNKLDNVVINLSFNNNQNILIKNNLFTITRVVNPYDYIIKGGYTNNKGILTIENNKINISVAQPSALYAIYAFQNDYNSAPVNYIRQNEINGTENKIKVEWHGANAGVTSKTFIEPIKGEHLTSKEIKKIDAGAKRSSVLISGTEL